MMRVGIPLLGNSPLGIMVAEVVAKLGKQITKPPQDLMHSELNFMSQQLGGAGGGAAGPVGGAPPRPMMPPAPPAPPMGAAPAEQAA